MRSRTSQVSKTSGRARAPLPDLREHGFSEDLLERIIPDGISAPIRERGIRDLVTALNNFGEILPESMSPEELVSFVRSSNAFDEYRIRNNLGVTVVFRGEVHRAYPGEKPLFIAYTEGGELQDKSVLIGMLDEGVRLAEAMQIKNILWDTPWDGGKTIVASEGKAYRAITTVYGEEELEDYVLGKGGVRFTRIVEGQDNQEHEDKKAIIEDWVASSITAGVLGRSYIAGPDMNMSKDMMSVIVNKAFAVAEELGIENFPLATTSRSIEEGGFDHFKWSVTSRGVVEGMLAVIRRKKLMERMGIDTSNLSVIIQGFGDVGSGVAKIIIEEYQRYGIKIVGVSDRHGAIYDSNGLDYDQLMGIRRVLEDAEERGLDKDRIHTTDLYEGTVERRWTAAAGENIDELLEQEATILVPAAGPNAITSANVGKLKVKMIIEGANNAIERGLERQLHDNGILYFRGELMNGGGVYTSTDEFFHFMMERDRLREHVDEYRVHVLDGITDLVISNVDMVLDRLEMEPHKTITDIVYETTHEMLERRTERLRHITPNLGRRADADVARSRGMMPKTMAITIAASESAREEIAYQHADTLTLYDTMQGTYSRERGQDIWSDYLDRRRTAVYILGKLRERSVEELGEHLRDNSRLLQTLTDIIRTGRDHPVVIKNAIEAIGNIMGWIPERQREDPDSLACQINEVLKGNENHPNESIRFWSKWTREKMGYLSVADNH